jgi:hypothetical protein
VDGGSLTAAVRKCFGDAITIAGPEGEDVLWADRLASVILASMLDPTFDSGSKAINATIAILTR